jgi:peptidoglycan/xylan/chitin deacetylase (PgdA/CDA1 family)
MISKREIAAAILGSRMPALLLRTGNKDLLPILAYHRVLDEPAGLFPFDEQVVSATPGDFRNQMRFVRDNFEVVSFDDLHRFETAGRPWPRRALIITFDDGYRDNYTNAFPILKELGLKATIFLATGHIGSGKPFWWDSVAFLVKNTRLTEIPLPTGPRLPSLNGNQSRREAIDILLGWLKKAPEAEKNRLLAALPAILKVEVPAKLVRGTHLNWDEVREMSREGIEFGSHTVTHPVLANVSEKQLEIELSQSKRTIEARIGKEVLAFAYPVGGRSFVRRTQEAVSRCGYRFAVSYLCGIARQMIGDRFALPRIHVEAKQSLNLFKANLMFPSLMNRTKQ